jgi:hypothetical protein
MRTSAVLAVAILVLAHTAHAEAPGAAERFTIGVPAEVTLVGLTAGVRPEVLYRFGDADARSRVRFAVGFLDGPEQFFMPFSLGYRAICRTRASVQPQFGAGFEVQNRIVSDYPTVRQYGFYVEGGVGYAATSQLSFGAMVALDVMLYGGPGAGLGPRVYASWRL